MPAKLAQVGAYLTNTPVQCQTLSHDQKKSFLQKYLSPEFSASKGAIVHDQRDERTSAAC